MTNIQKIRELISKAQEMQDISTGEYRRFQDDYRKKLGEIKANRDYSPAGKEKLAESLKKKATIELLRESREYRNLYNKYLADAKKMAIDLIYAKTPKLEQEVIDRFSRDFKEIKTEIMLSSPAKGKEILQSFLSGINEPALAEIVKNDFAEVIQPIISGAGNEAAKYKRDLLHAFDSVKTSSMDPEAKAAMQVVEFADYAISSGKFFNLAVEQAVGENLGATAKKYLHNPDDYFALFPDDDKPIQRTVADIMEEEEAKTL